MRTSASIRNRVALGLLAGLIVSTACNGAPAEPAPAEAPRREAPPRDPATLPRLDTSPRVVPTAREGEQLPTAELEKLLADAAGHATAGKAYEAKRLLETCANRIPASARCDGRFGLLLLEAKPRRDEARYYLREAARTDEPAADAALYDEVAAGLQRLGELDDAAASLALALAREDTSERSLVLARVLTAIPARKQEGADLLARIREKGDSADLLFEEAVIRAQIPGQFARAADLFEEYGKRTAGQPTAKLDSAQLTARIAEIRKLVDEGKDVAEATAPVNVSEPEAPR